MTTGQHPTPPPVSIVRRLVSWRTARILLLTVLSLIALLFLAVAVENWRGKRAWEQCRRELETQGERLDFEAFVPTPVPPDENFLETPFFATARSAQSAFEVQRQRESGESPNDLYFDLRMDGGSPWPTGGNLDQGTFTDFAAWRAFYQGNTNYPQADSSLSAGQTVRRRGEGHGGPLGTGRRRCAGMGPPGGTLSLPYFSARRLRT